ncbi:MAG: hypothetical protein IT562_15365 [Alphaproteobacteria bacterium]|nr:hypothetical protein [Alphaproteobacteria bacterium]
MEILICISILVAVAVLTAKLNFAVALLLSASISFVLWISAQALGHGSLVDWPQSFVPLSLGVSAGCFVLLWSTKQAVQHWQETRRVREVFSTYLSPSTAREFAAHPERLRLHTEAKTVDYIVFQVEGAPAESVSALFERAFPINLDAGATIEDVTQSIAIATFGALQIEKPAAAGARQALVERLIAELGDRIRVVHGRATCLVGNYGSSQRFSFGSLIPNFTAVLSDLLALKFGMAKDLGR